MLGKRQIFDPGAGPLPQRCEFLWDESDASVQGSRAASAPVPCHSGLGEGFEQFLKSLIFKVWSKFGFTRMVLPTLESPRTSSKLQVAIQVVSPTKHKWVRHLLQKCAHHPRTLRVPSTWTLTTILDFQPESHMLFVDWCFLLIILFWETAGYRIPQNLNSHSDDSILRCCTLSLQTWKATNSKKHPPLRNGPKLKWRADFWKLQFSSCPHTFCLKWTLHGFEGRTRHKGHPESQYQSNLQWRVHVEWRRIFAACADYTGVFSSFQTLELSAGS